MEKRVGLVGIVVEKREQNAEKVNLILSRYADSILARTGLPHRGRQCGVITLVVEMDTDSLGSLTGQLGNLDGVQVKSALAKN